MSQTSMEQALFKVAGLLEKVAVARVGRMVAPAVKRVARRGPKAQPTGVSGGFSTESLPDRIPLETLYKLRRLRRPAAQGAPGASGGAASAQAPAAAPAPVAAPAPAAAQPSANPAPKTRSLGSQLWDIVTGRQLRTGANQVRSGVRLMNKNPNAAPSSTAENRVFSGLRNMGMGALKTTGLYGAGVYGVSKTLGSSDPQYYR